MMNCEMNAHLASLHPMQLRMIQSEYLNFLRVISSVYVSHILHEQHKIYITTQEAQSEIGYLGENPGPNGK